MDGLSEASRRNSCSPDKEATKASQVFDTGVFYGQTIADLKSRKKTSFAVPTTESNNFELVGVSKQQLDDFRFSRLSYDNR